jgi:serine protease
MADKSTLLAKSRLVVGGAAVLAFGGYLAASHHTADEGMSADAITPQTIRDAAAELGPASPWLTGDYLVDFVEPDDGEGGSEDAITSRVVALDALPDVEVEPAGFYSEGEHLYRVRADASAWDSIDDGLFADPLVEVVEPEIFLALPDADVVAAVDDPEAQKPPRHQVDDPMFHLQWHMEQIHAPEAWASERGDGVIVAVIDTGVAWKDAKGVKQLPDLAGTKFTKGESFISGLPDGLDDHAHGSHVAGTIAQTTNNGVGVTGIAHEATIMPLKVLSGDGRGSVPGIANAIRYAADNGAHVINMSLGGPLPSKVLAKAIEYAHEKGVTTVCAAGNESRSRVGYPAANKYSVAVSATNFDRGLTFYSNWGKDIDIAAPGGDTRSDKNGDGAPDGVLQNTIKIQKPLENDYLWFQGTSMASPHAAGVAALIVGTGVTNPDEVERVLKETADHPDGKTWDQKFGAGIVNAQTAVAKAQGDYAGERAGLLGFLALLGIGGFGVAGLVARRRFWAAAGLGGTAVLASGALGTTPIAYGIAGVAGAFGSPLFLSAALPLLATLLLMGWKPARPVLAGLALGYAALLAHGALVLPTLLDGLPGGPVIDRIWLAANAAFALWLAARISRR